MSATESGLVPPLAWLVRRTQWLLRLLPHRFQAAQRRGGWRGTTSCTHTRNQFSTESPGTRLNA